MLNSGDRGRMLASTSRPLAPPWVETFGARTFANDAGTLPVPDPWRAWAAAMISGLNAFAAARTVRSSAFWSSRP